MRGREQVRRGGHVAAHEGAPARGGQPARGIGAELPYVLVGRRELGEEPVRLLEVVAEDLLVLERTVAVDAVGPLDELLVQRGALALEQALVDGVADEDVVEGAEVGARRARPPACRNCVRVELVGLRRDIRRA